MSIFASPAWTPLDLSQWQWASALGCREAFPENPITISWPGSNHSPGADETASGGLNKLTPDHTTHRRAWPHTSVLGT